MGTYETLAELIEAHPSGTEGDAYIVGADIYAWNDDVDNWVNMGRFVGPTGPTGATGAAGATILDSYETLADLINAHPTGTAGDAYIADGKLYVWSDDAGNWVDMGSIIGPTGATAPFVL